MICKTLATSNHIIFLEIKFIIFYRSDLHSFTIPDDAMRWDFFASKNTFFFIKFLSKLINKENLASTVLLMRLCQAKPATNYNLMDYGLF